MQKVKVKIKKIHPDAKIPIYGSEEAAAFDVYSIEDKEIMSGKTEVIRTGICLEIEEGYCYQFWDRSGIGIKGIHHFAGLIDSDYRGEFRIVLHNSTSETFKVSKGDRIVQVAIVPIVRAEFEEVQELNESERGSGGFHSTGRR